MGNGKPPIGPRRNAWSRAMNQDDGCAAPCFMIVRHHPIRANGFANFRCCLCHTISSAFAASLIPHSGCLKEKRFSTLPALHSVEHNKLLFIPRESKVAAKDHFQAVLFRIMRSVL